MYPVCFAISQSYQLYVFDCGAEFPAYIESLCYLFAGSCHDASTKSAYKWLGAPGIIGYPISDKKDGDK